MDPGPVSTGADIFVAEGDAVDVAFGQPTISADPRTGRSLVVYNAQDDGAHTIRARMISEQAQIGAELVISVGTPSEGLADGNAPSASWNSTNSTWLVTWATSSTVYGQIVTAAGELSGAPFTIAASRGGASSGVDDFFSSIDEVRAEWSPEHEVWFVSWNAAGEEGGVAFTQAIYSTILDDSGAWVLDGNAVRTSDEPAGNGVALAYSSTSDVWAVGWNRPLADDLPGARIVAIESVGGGLFDFTNIGVPLAVSTTREGAAEPPSLAWDEMRDRFIILWRADPPGGVLINEQYFNFIDADGSFVEADEVEISADGAEPGRASVDYSPMDDEFLVVASHLSGGAYQLVQHTISGAGDSVGVGTAVTSMGDLRDAPSVSWGGGCFRVAWQELGTLGNFLDTDDFPDSPDAIRAQIGCKGCTEFAAGSVSFDDVEAGRFFDIPVGYLLHAGLTTGTGPRAYSPDDGVTRGQVATFLYRLEGEPAGPLGSAVFNDVPAGAFFDRAVGWMDAEGLTTGTGPGTFDPNRVITRAELATFLYRYVGEPAAPLGSASFGDVPVGSFFDAAVGWLFAEGLTTGTGEGVYSPQDVLTRGQLATFLFRLLDITHCETFYSS